MANYEAVVSYIEEVKVVLGFEAENDIQAREVLEKNLPPLQDLKIESVQLVAAGNDTTLN